MKQYLMITAATLFGVSAAQAQTSIDADTDLNGSVSLEEAQAMDPSVTETDFAVYDLNADGELSAVEYAAWNEDRSSATADAGFESDTSSMTENAAAESDLEIDGDTDLTPEPLSPALEANPEPVLEPDLTTDLEPAAEAGLNSDADANPEPVLEQDLTTDIEPEAETEVDVETDAEADAETDTEAEVEMDGEGNIDPQ